MNKNVKQKSKQMDKNMKQKGKQMNEIKQKERNALAINTPLNAIIIVQP